MSDLVPEDDTVQREEIATSTEIADEGIDETFANGVQVEQQGIVIDVEGVVSADSSSEGGDGSPTRDTVLLMNSDETVETEVDVPSSQIGTPVEDISVPLDDEALQDPSAAKVEQDVAEPVLDNSSEEKVSGVSMNSATEAPEEAGQPDESNKVSDGAVGTTTEESSVAKENKDISPKKKKKKKFVAKVQPKCAHCGKTVYLMDQTKDSKETLYHKACLRCTTCKTDLSYKEPVMDPERLTIAGSQYRVVDGGEDGTKQLLCHIHATINRGENIQGKRASTKAKDESELKMVEALVHPKTAEIKEEMEVLMGDMVPVCGRCGGPLNEDDNIAVSGMEKFHKICPSAEEIARFQVSTRYYLKRVDERVVLLLRTEPEAKGLTFLFLLDEDSKRLALLSKKKEPCMLSFSPDKEARTALVKTVKMADKGVEDFSAIVKEFGEFKIIHPVTGDKFIPSFSELVASEMVRKLELVSPLPDAPKRSKKKKKPEAAVEPVKEVPIRATLLQNGNLSMQVESETVEKAIRDEESKIMSSKGNKKAKAKALAAFKESIVPGSIVDRTTATMDVEVDWSKVEFEFKRFEDGVLVQDGEGIESCTVLCQVEERARKLSEENSEATRSQPPGHKKSQSSSNPLAADEGYPNRRTWKLQLEMPGAIGRIWKRRVDELLQKRTTENNQVRLTSFGLEKGVLRTLEADAIVNTEASTLQVNQVRLYLEVYNPPIVKIVQAPEPVPELSMQHEPSVVPEVTVAAQEPESKVEVDREANTVSPPSITSDEEANLKLPSESSAPPQASDPAVANKEVPTSSKKKKSKAETKSKAKKAAKNKQKQKKGGGGCSIQ